MNFLQSDKIYYIDTNVLFHYKIMSLIVLGEILGGKYGDNNGNKK